jgi:hypothetical protein
MSSPDEPFARRFLRAGSFAVVCNLIVAVAANADVVPKPPGAATAEIALPIEKAAGEGAANGSPAHVSTVAPPRRAKGSIAGVTRCWQEGRLVYEGADLVPMEHAGERSPPVLTLSASGHPETLVRVIDLQRGICIVETTKPVDAAK